VDVGTTVRTEFLGEIGGISDVGLGGLLKRVLPGRDAIRVREDGEFSGVIEITDGLGEFLLNKLKSVHLLAIAEGECDGHASRDIKEEDDFAGGGAEKVALGSQIIKDLSGFVLGGDISEHIDDDKLIFNINDVVLEGSEGVKLVILEGESVQNRDDLFAG